MAQVPAPEILSNSTTVPIILDGHLQRHVISAQTVNQAVSFENLIVGETYSIIVPNDPTLAACWPTVSTADPSVEILNVDPAQHLLEIKVASTRATVQFDYPCTWSADDPPRHYISIACSSCLKKSVKDYLKALQNADAVAPIEVSGEDAETLVEDVLIGGNCFDITGVTFSGNAAQIGTFSNGTNNIGLPNGMIMATGDISVALGPNDVNNASAGFGVGTPDGDLAILSNGGGAFDRAMIEFDFTPTQSPLTFDYVFASEEYCEYVGSQFNDVFGFFISGPGISGPFAGNAANIASLGPGSYVAINTINHNSNAGLYNNNTPAGLTLCGQNPSVLPAVNELQFDGYTRKLTAVANVIPCSTYHIKLKVADIGDGIFDSAVFLRAGSFDAGGNASVEWVVNGDPDAGEVFESCGTVQLVFRRVGTNPAVPLPVTFTITGTATSGLDYSAIPASVVIPAGQMQLTIPVNIVADALLEGTETIIITLTNPCSCLNPQEILYINDLPLLDAEVDTVTICGAGPTQLTVQPIGGVGPYTYQWQPTGNTQTITPFVTTTSNYRVTVTDACGKTVVRTARVIIAPPPSGTLTPPAPQICPGQTGVLNVNLNGTGPFTITYKFNNQIQTQITGIASSPYQLTVTEPGVYQLIQVIDANGCPGTGVGQQIVTQSAIDISGVTTNVQCAGQANGSINTTVTAGQQPFTYAWTGPVPVASVADPTGLIGGTYEVTVTDQFGCTSSDTYNVNNPAILTPTVAGTQAATCASPTGGSITLNVQGGTPNYTFQWSNGAGTAQSPQNLGPGNYTVTVTDSHGCSRTATATVPSNIAPPIATTTSSGNLTCQATSVTLNGNGSSSGAGFTYNWTASPGNLSGAVNGLTATATQAGTYTLVVTNTQNGCTASSTQQVQANNTAPVASAGPNVTLTCTLINATLDGTGSSQNGNYSYAWSGGSIIGGGTTLTPVVGATGGYTLTVTNNDNGCTATSSVQVGSNTATPTAAIDPTGLLTCASTQVTLNGINSTPSGNLTFLWTTPNGNIISGAAAPTAVINEDGDYTLLVTNTQNGCTDTETITVTQDFSDPSAAVAVNGQLNCITTQLSLNATVTSSTQNYSFQWTPPAGVNFVSGQNTLNPIINAPGTYTIVVTNNISNCTASASILIDADHIAPAANAGTPEVLTCTTTSAILGPTNPPSDPNLVYSWSGGTISSGGNTPNPTITAPGIYTVVVTNQQNGCSGTASVNITQNITPPNAVAAPGGQITCSSPSLQLSAAGSSTGANFSYQWSTVGGTIGAGGNTLSPTVTAAGAYTLTVTNSQNGCTASASTTVTNSSSLPTAVAAVSGTITCNTPQVTVNGSGSSAGANYSYNWATNGGTIVAGQGTSTITAGGPGIYTIIVTNTTNNCSSTFSIDVPADLAPPQADAGNALTLNCTQPSMMLDGSASSSGANFSYQWSALTGGNFVSSTTMMNPLVDQPGTYQLVVTNTTNGCTAADQVVVVSDASDPVVVIAPPAVLTCANTQLVLDASASSNGGTQSYNWTAANGGNIIGSATVLNPTVDEPGSYTLVITNSANGCTSDATITVAEDVQAPGVDAGPDFTLTCAAPQQALGSATNPGGSNYTYQWVGQGISTPNAPNPTVSQAGTFTLVITNTANGCSATDDVTIGIDQVAPLADAGAGFQLTCVDNSYTLAATASQGAQFSYQWTTSGTGSFTTPSNMLNPTVNGAGTYNLLVTNTQNGCTSSSSVQISQSADVPIATIAQPAVLTCTTTTVTLDGIGSSSGSQFSYLWTGAGIVSGSNTLNPIVDQPGTFVLAVTDQTNNCTSYTEINVPQDIAAPVVEAGTQVTLTCTATSLNLSGSVTPPGTFTYQWQALNGGNITAGATTLTPTVDAVGQYELLVTNTNNGCTSTDLVDVLADQNAPIALIAPAPTLTCNLTQQTLDASASSPGTSMQYVWTTIGGAFVSLADPLHPVINAPGTYTLNVTDTSNGCTTSTTLNVSQDVTLPVAEAGTGGTITCDTTTLTLNGAGSSQNGNFFYAWSTGNGMIIGGGSSLTPIVSEDGIYTLVVTNADNGCTASDNVLVSINTQIPMVNIAPPAALTCSANQVLLNGINSQVGPTITYSWSTVDGFIVSGQNTPSATVNQPGPYTLTVFNTANGCSNTGSTNVVENTIPPIVDAGTPAQLTCTVVQATLQGYAPAGSLFTYTWSTATGFIAGGANTLTPQVSEPGLYQLLCTNLATGCSAFDTVEVLVETNLPTDIVYEVARPTCRNDDAIVTITHIAGGVGPYQYSIDNGQTFSDFEEFSSLTPGQYDLVIQDANGCLFDETANIPASPSVTVELLPEINLSLGESADLIAQLPTGFPTALLDTVMWSPLQGLTFESNALADLLHPVAAPNGPTLYTVTVITKDGCEATDRVLINVDDEPFVYIPNVFSPWDEGDKNDKVVIYAKDSQVRIVKRFQIFDRWGEMVFLDEGFRPNDPAHGWDGRLGPGGKLMTPAVFVYTAEIELVDGRVLLLKGDVTLLR